MEIAAFLQCFKNPYATYKCLESFRRFYPTSTVVLLSDNGYNYSKMAEYFQCIYIHCDKSATFIHKDLDTGSHFLNTNKLIQRITSAFQLIKEDYIMWLEDDVSVNGSISVPFRYDLNGYCPNIINRSSIQLLAEKYRNIDPNVAYRFTGHGGSVYKRTALLECFDNKLAIDDVLTNWKIYGFPTTLCQDYFFSILLIINGKTIGYYEGHGEKGRHDIDSNILVQHQYKHWYGVPLPDQLAHLVSADPFY